MADTTDKQAATEAAPAPASPPPQQPQEGSTDAPAQRRRRVLTVGDGNFSFSLAFAKRHVNDANAPELVATSYDSYEELVAKYPESKRICAQLRELGAMVLHRVDATHLRASLLEAAASTADTVAAIPTTFDTVVFNHPHCGEENVRRHQSLLSHFYVSALEVLDEGCSSKDEDENGIHLTLAQGQPERWQALERAARAGLVLHRQVEDVDADEHFGLRYERKRHQNGKSFHQVTLHGEKTKQASTLFIFCRSAANSTAAIDTKVTEMQSESKAKSRKRKAQTELKLEFACSQCEKSFKSAQGLRTHVHMVHELEAVAPVVELPCPFCDRSFKKEDARRQHQLAKHGKDPLIRPDWFQQKETAASAGSTEKTTPVETEVGERTKPEACAICQLEFASQEELDAHWRNLQPRAAAKRHCSMCEREFDEERALRQHQNFCGQATS